MKKLTAGIFTVILGLTTVDAFAAIPTQAYVDSAVEYALDQAEAARATANAAAPQATTYTKTEVNDLVNGVSGSLTGYVTDGEFTEFQTSNTAAIADAKKAGTDAATAAAAAQQTADSKLQVTGTCPAGKTCYLDATGAIQVAVDDFDSSKLNGASTN